MIDKKNLSMKWAEENILLALCALKNIGFEEKKIMSRQFVTKKNSAAPRSEKNILTQKKKHSSPPPLS